MTSSLLVKIMQDTGARVPTSLGFYAGLNDSDYAYEKPLPAIDFDLDNTGDRHENSGLEPRPFSSPTIGRVPLEPSEDTPNTPGKPRKPRKPRKQATTAPKAPVTPAAKGSTSKTKVCSQCGGRKPAALEHFAQHNATRDRLTQHCRICRSANNKARRSKDPIMRLRHHFSTRISATVPDCPAGYVADLELYLGYKLKDLVTKLDVQCERDYGRSLIDLLNEGYHIDHITPLSSFKIESIKDAAFRTCWAVRNLRCIPAEENMSKGASIIE